MTRIKFFQDSEGFDLDGSAPHKTMDQRWMYLVAGPDELVHPLPTAQLRFLWFRTWVVGPGNAPNRWFSAETYEEVSCPSSG